MTATNGTNGTKVLTHPLGPLTGQEIVQTSTLIKALWLEDNQIQFKTITLQEPAKAELLPYLNAERAGQPTPRIDRRAFVVYYLRGTVRQPDTSLPYMS